MNRYARHPANGAQRRAPRGEDTEAAAKGRHAARRARGAPHPGRGLVGG